jgi:hypothetical protein
MTQGIGIYSYDETTGVFSRYSMNGAMDDPIHIVHNGIDGSVIMTKLFLHNPDSTYKYSNLTITPTPTQYVGEDNSIGLEFKLLTGDRQPTQSDWDSRTTGTAVQTTSNYAIVSPKNYYFPNIEDQQYYPFWAYTKIPPRTSSLVNLGISLQMQYDKVLV